MRNKKLFSTVVAGALAATTMAMPVMAADTGSVDVEFTTKTPVIRVAVPTTILAQVDPLEMNTSGTQIHSGDFTLMNKSEVPVGIDVKSIVDLGTGVTLTDTKAEAAASKDTTKYEAWMGVAAQTSAGNYIETANKTAGDLADTDNNVATFKTVSSESSASQTFYLDKASTATATYKIAAPVATGGKTAAQYKEELTYAQVYALNEETLADVDALVNLLKTKDVYEGTADTDGTVLTLIPAGTTSYASFDKDNKKYFTAATTNSLESMADGTKYVYGEAANGTGTAFRYIGKLGQGKTDWSDTQIDEMHITYSIYGLTDDAYTAANVTGTYGLYIANAAPSIATKSYQVAADTPVNINVDLGTGTLKAADVTSVKWKEVDIELLNNSQFPDFAVYANKTITLSDTSVNAMLADNNNLPATLVVTFDDTAETSIEVTLTK